jgi:hydroxyacylglutathione hydrolase
MNQERRINLSMLKIHYFRTNKLLMKIKTFVFNDFQENTYILYDDTKECMIIDPGCNNSSERKQLSDFIATNELTPVALINTHCHIDHILGNEFVSKTYNLFLQAHNGEEIVLANSDRVAQMYGISYTPSPPITQHLEPGTTLSFGNQSFQILFTPGHSPASICLYNAVQKKLIAGDVLFHMSIGRTDLPGGNYDTLIYSIESQLMPLPDDTTVYPGHGIPTTIGNERTNNPFLNQ